MQVNSDEKKPARRMVRAARGNQTPTAQTSSSSSSSSSSSMSDSSGITTVVTTNSLDLPNPFAPQQHAPMQPASQQFSMAVQPSQQQQPFALAPLPMQFAPQQFSMPAQQLLPSQQMQFAQPMDVNAMMGMMQAMANLNLALVQQQQQQQLQQQPVKVEPIKREEGNEIRAEIKTPSVKEEKDTRPKAALFNDWGGRGHVSEEELCQTLQDAILKTAYAAIELPQGTASGSAIKAFMPIILKEKSFTKLILPVGSYKPTLLKTILSSLLDSTTGITNLTLNFKFSSKTKADTPDGRKARITAILKTFERLLSKSNIQKINCEDLSSEGEYHFKAQVPVNVTLLFNGVAAKRANAQVKVKPEDESAPLSASVAQSSSSSSSSSSTVKRETPPPVEQKQAPAPTSTLQLHEDAKEDHMNMMQDDSISATIVSTPSSSASSSSSSSSASVLTEDKEDSIVDVRALLLAEGTAAKSALDFFMNTLKRSPTAHQISILQVVIPMLSAELHKLQPTDTKAITSMASVDAMNDEKEKPAAPSRSNASPSSSSSSSSLTSYLAPVSYSQAALASTHSTVFNSQATKTPTTPPQVALTVVKIEPSSPRPQ